MYIFVYIYYYVYLLSIFGIVYTNKIYKENKKNNEIIYK
uniref:Uncharacterized protein n=1 Tax=viral metagenome TaxID=1070528 RepID=A0A6C0KXW7_9ZZZZ